jgi:uncharacterized lipoprotein YmbA
LKFNTGLVLGVCVLVAACASKPDRFYALTVLPDTTLGAAPAPTIHVRLDVTVPSLVDRAEIVLNKPNNGILILDHERWAEPFADQVSQTLARDIEKHRKDVLIGDRSFDQAAAQSVNLKVDIVRMSARQPGQVTIEAHWRIVDTKVGLDQLGSCAFDAPLDSSGYAAVARAYSQTLSTLAETLAAAIPPR